MTASSAQYITPIDHRRHRHHYHHLLLTTANMRASLRLLATLQKTQYLEAGTPTGITGLLTANSPRSQLLWLYNSTLDKLKSFPDHSVYRQSTEALTRHRMNIIESIRPEGLDAWQSRVAHLVNEHPAAFKRIEGQHGSNIVYAPSQDTTQTVDQRIKADYKSKPNLEGPQNEEDVATRGQQMSKDLVAEDATALMVEPEPPLTTTQVQQLEQEIGAGLIEEVIAVAESERNLVDTLAENKV